jgi:hypothetical protein
VTPGPYRAAAREQDARSLASRIWRLLRFGLGLLAVTSLGLGIIFRLRGLMLEDDAFIFVRYAENLLAHHAIAWNPGGPPSYGTTSLLHLGFVTMLRALFGPQPASVALLGSLLPGLGFLAVLPWVCWRRILRGARGGGALGLLLLLPLAISIDTLGAHVATGMDTSLSMVYAVLLLVLADRLTASPAPGRATAMALVAAGAWVVRPDLLLLSVPIVIALCLALWMRGQRTLCVRLVVTTAILLVLQWALCWSYFGTPVPLSFYVKSAVRYGASMDAAYAAVPGRELWQFFVSYWPYWLLIGAAIGAAARRRCWPFAVVESGALAGALLFVLYYRYAVLQVMPHYHRFYYPTLPVWVWLAARAAVALANVGNEGLRSHGRVARQVLMGAGLVLGIGAAVLLVRPWSRWLTHVRAHPWFTAIPAVQNLDGWSKHWWFRLAEMSALPNDVTWATTEIGLPGALNPGRTIIDLSGLNDIEFARHGFSAEALFRDSPPDLIYMPHPDYREMTEELIRNPRFRAAYDYYPARALGTRLALAVAATDRTWWPSAPFSPADPSPPRAPQPTLHADCCSQRGKKEPRAAAAPSADTTAGCSGGSTPRAIRRRR